MPLKAARIKTMLQAIDGERTIEHARGLHERYRVLTAKEMLNDLFPGPPHIHEGVVDMRAVEGLYDLMEA